MNPSPSSAHPDPGTDFEFNPGASTWPRHLSRRKFLEVSAAMTAMWSMGGCLKRSREPILPYIRQPEGETPGIAEFYATAFSFHGYARGILAKSYQGRPLKLEGNPKHPESGGTSDATMQASVLDLYDPDRLKSPRKGNHPATFTLWANAIWPRLEGHRESNGKGLGLLLPSTTSPTALRLVRELRRIYPRAILACQKPAFAVYDREDWKIGKADVIFGINPDFLTGHPSSLRYAKDFAERRKGWRTGKAMNRFYALEAAPSLTGSMADEFHHARPQEISTILHQVVSELNGSGKPAELSAEALAFAQKVASDLRRGGSRALVVAGSCASPEEKQFASEINGILGNAGVTRQPVPATQLDEVLDGLVQPGELRKAIQAGAVTTALFLEANPVLGGQPGQWQEALRACPFSTSLSTHGSELSEDVSWQLPAFHYLETWNDLRAFTGEPSIVQPLIEPLVKGRSLNAILDFLAEGVFTNDYKLVRDTWKANAGNTAEKGWRQALSNGLATVDIQPDSPNVGGDATKTTMKAKPPPRAAFILQVRPSPYLGHAGSPNNAWLQELPQPITTECWGNAVWMSEKDGRRLGLDNGSVAMIEGEGFILQTPVHLVAGVPEGVLVGTHGYGRRGVGSVASRIGVFIAPGETPYIGIERIKRTDRHVQLVETQHHHKMEGHEFVKLRKTGKEPEKEEKHFSPASLYGEAPGKLSDGEHAWAMSIDLGACFGCKACVIACQAENNIPSVGPEQVVMGREMHWIRVDSYQHSEAHSTRWLHQPVPCMHCEKAPCEAVCPVEATVHTRSGLNAMVYNRCVGTRYCSNNCPYKVRRFNFLDYRAHRDSPVHMQKNPEVTVRERGVMEKCTYCIQRINTTRSMARRENRRIQANEIQTACQQACPAAAITFGDLKNPESHVAGEHELKESYSLLEELDVRPRTKYLPKWLNPAGGENHA